jgi:hypothetical protein
VIAVNGKRWTGSLPEFCCRVLVFLAICVVSACGGGSSAGGGDGSSSVAADDSPDSNVGDDGDSARAYVPLYDDSTLLEPDLQQHTVLKSLIVDQAKPG